MRPASGRPTHDRLRRARGRRRVRPEPRLAHRDPPRPPPGRGRDDAADPGPGRVPHPVARPLDHRHHGPPDPRPLERVSAPPADIDELLSTVNRQLDIDLGRGDIVGTYAGMRPLVGDPGGSTVKASREHRVAGDASGLVRISGGKYTTYRVMARDVVDASLGRTKRGGASRARPSCRSSARRRARSWRRSARASSGRSGSCRLPAARPAHVAGPRRRAARGSLRARGDRRHVARSRARPRGSPRRGHRPSPGRGRLGGPHELALSLDDVLARRMRLAQELPDRGARSRRVSRRSSAPSWAGTTSARPPRSSGYLETARREYGLPWAT